ncbi:MULTISPECIES: hypothetical protein [unclassified Spirosoma]|uniref:hypothetical protein n=1 Tax=unclassified Spirosoma TaxID=2621999 RepID=UPI0009612B5F|nr:MULTISPECIES: hypothetical protein [unclassified Spirosoma]MBN8823980.1 hypothetical protein [Spirosoma sp.]OJW70391.1 MAG: hypothetical protein BGO59_24325 [Spirosoma sp. 48-14]
MKNRRLFSCIVLLILSVFSCEKRICGCVFPTSPLAGDWALNSITYPMTQKTVTASEAGYSETLTFDGLVSNGSYRQVRNGLPIQNSTYTLSFPKGGSTEGIIYFSKDSTEQSFQLAGMKLYLSERVPRGAVLADGAIYEYKQQ